MFEIDNVYCIDALEGLQQLRSESVNLVITSPPYLKGVRVSYDSKSEEDYLNWFSVIAREIFRILTSNGSFILNINDSCTKNSGRSVYVHELVVELRKNIGFYYFDKMVWVKKNGLPTSGPLRRADYFEYIFHFSKNLKPIFNINEIREPYPETSVKRSKSKIKNNTSNKESRDQKLEINCQNLEIIGPNSETSNLNLETSNLNLEINCQNPVIIDKTLNYKEWKLNEFGSWPKNTLFFKKATGKETGHPAPFDLSLPEHFIKAHSNINDLILDPFCGSGTALEAARLLNRRFLGFDNKAEYIEISKKRLKIP